VPGAAVGTRSRSIVTLRQMTQGDASRANKINGDKGDVASNDASPNFPGERAAKQFDRNIVGPAGDKGRVLKCAA